MIGSDPTLSVSPADDAFHPPDSSDPSWIETVWLPFWLPDSGASVHLRLWFMPNAGKQGGSVAGWRGSGEGLFGDSWTEALVGPPDLMDLRLPNGLRWECLEPLHRYRVRHRSARVELDLTFESILPPHPVAPEESPGMFDGHLEQPGRVTGWLRFGGREHPVDCHGVRDRSWGPRIARPDLRIGNAHGTAEDLAFFAYVNPAADGTELITSGYVLRDGLSAEIRGGLRETSWIEERPRQVELRFEDAAGRSFSFRGDCVNHAARNAGQGIVAVLNLVRWSQGEKTVAWGENHDVWSHAAWLAAGREPL